MTKEVSSVYIHIPFCKNICSYCDFTKVLYNEDFAFKYLIALEKEIIDKYMKETIKTIYIGGGTPSALSMSNLIKLFNIIKLFNLSEDVEFTFECNIEDIRVELLELLKENNVNRLSLGVESFDEKKLKILGRETDYIDTKEKIKLIREYGFNNINIDLIYALEGETLSTLNSDIRKVLKLNPEHISTYSLIIEDNTLLKVKKTEYIDDILDSLMYKSIIKKLKRRKYYQYEVSNFSKEGYNSKHNLVYWNNLEYYGFGLGAAGYVSGVRYENTKNLTQYNELEFTSTKEMLSRNEIIDYELILGLRKTKGINLLEFKEKYDVDITEVYEFNNLIKKKMLILKNGHLYINPKKIYLMNEILVKILD